MTSFNIGFMYKLKVIAKITTVLSGLFLLLVVTACDQPQKAEDLYTLTAYSQANKLRAVIEIPAGTNKKIEFQPKTNTFVVDKRDDKDRVIDYLPYLGNYGFIPGTYSDPDKGGDGDALDILVLCESLPTATVVEVYPIAVLPLIDEGEQDYKIIAIPVDIKLQTITARNLSDLRQNYPQIEQIISQWFLNYDRGNTLQLNAMGDTAIAKLEIQKHLKS